MEKSVYRSGTNGRTPQEYFRHYRTRRYSQCAGTLFAKNFLDALLTAAAEPEAVKINKKIADDHFLLDHATPFCSCYAAEQRSLRQEDKMGAHRVLNFYGSQLNRISDAISVKRGELLRIKKLLQSRLGTSDTATRYHYEDMILRINTALGIK